MKTFQVVFKKRINRKKSRLVEAADHRRNGSRLEFINEHGDVIEWFDVFKVESFSLFSDPDDPKFYRV